MTRILPDSSLAVAQMYVRGGWFPIPLCWPVLDGVCGCGRHHASTEVGKAPLVSWTPFVTSPPTEDDIRKWWTIWPRANIGLLLDPSGLLIVDIDSSEALFEANQKGLPPGAVVRTAKGQHHYYRAPVGVTGRSTRRGGSRAIDILAGGYIVAPPSIHRTGHQYAWVSKRSLTPAPAWAVNMIAQTPPTSPPTALDLPTEIPIVDVDTLDLPASIRRLIQEGRKADPTRYPSRSEASFAATLALVQAGVDDKTIAAIMLDPRYGISEKSRQRGRRWLAAEIGRAQAKWKHAQRTAAVHRVIKVRVG